MAKKVKLAQIVAFIALFAILASVVSTWILILFSGNGQPEVETELTPEQIEELKNLINSQSGETSTWSETESWEILSESGKVE